MHEGTNRNQSEVAMTLLFFLASKGYDRKKRKGKDLCPLVEMPGYLKHIVTRLAHIMPRGRGVVHGKGSMYRKDK